MRKVRNKSAAAPRQAFGLVEVMIVLVCLAMIAAVAMSTFGSPHVQRLRGATQILTADLDFARVGALANAADPYVLVFDADGRGYHIGVRSTPDTPIVHPGTGEPYIVQFGQGRAHHLAGVSIDSLQIGDDRMLGFGSFGQLDPEMPATLTLNSGDRSVTVSLDPVTGEAAVGEVQ